MSINFIKSLIISSINRYKRFWKTIFKYWKRLFIGAFISWGIVNFILISLLVALEYFHINYNFYDYSLFAQILLMASVPFGSLIAYAMRKN